MPSQVVSQVVPEDAGYQGDPVHLTASIDLQSPSASGVNVAALKNPIPGPMEIMEVKFGLRIPTPSTTVSAGVSGGVVGIQFMLGDIPVTNGHVPVWLFGREANIGAEQVLGNSTTPFTYAEYRWKLAHPLYVPTGWVLTPTFQHFGQIKQSIYTRISYGARVLPIGAKKPSAIKVPYVASFVSKTFTTYGAADTDRSAETDLVNKIGAPLHLVRFVGRINAFFLSSAVVYTSDFEGDETSTGASDLRGRLLTVDKMIDSVGNQLVRDPTLYGSVFAGATRTWEIGRDLVVPSEWYAIVDLGKAAPVTTPSGVYQAQAQIGMEGWREVAI